MKPIQIFLGSGDPDDLDRLKRQFRANGGLLDQSKRSAQPAFAPQAAATIPKVAAVDLKEPIAKLLGNRAASVQSLQRRPTRRVGPRDKALNAIRAVMGHQLL
jgi:hypothetical protein